MSQGILAIIDLDNGWSPTWHQAFNTNIDGLMLIGPGGIIVKKKVFYIKCKW